MTADTSAPESLREQNRAFWEARGRGSPGPGHASTMLSEHARFTEHVHRMEIAFLQRRLPAAARVLDLGCGEGRLALSLAPHAREVVGLDLSHGLVERARRHAARGSVGNVRFEQHALEQPLPVSGFDAVLLSGVLNCVDDETVRVALTRAAEALERGGLLYLRNNCANREAFFLPADGQRAPTRHRTGGEYLAHVEATTGLEVLEERYLFAPLLWPNLVYYHALPRGLRDRRPIARLLDAWFAIEERTSESRLHLLGPMYGPILRFLRKPTSFRILLARRT